MNRRSPFKSSPHNANLNHRSELAGLSKEDYKRTQKLKKEHRKTRVIRIDPEASLLNDVTNSGNDSVDKVYEMSPYSEAKYAMDQVGATPDDRAKDPDWAKTPLGKKRGRLTISKKVITR
jgi:hypothetical protein